MKLRRFVTIFTLATCFCALSAQQIIPELIPVWRASDSKPVTVLNHIASIDGMRFSHSGSLLATGDEAGQVNIWDTSDPDPLNWPSTPIYIIEQGPDENRPDGGSGHSDVNSIDWTQDDRFIVTAGRNLVVKGKYTHDGLGNIRIYRVLRDPGDNYELISTEPVFRQEYFHFNSDGSQLVSSHEDGTLRLWQVLVRPL